MRFLISILFLAVTGCGEVGTPYSWNLPPGVPPPPVPATNKMTQEKVSLGRALFYDRRLSGNGEQACATCHIQAFAFAEPRDQAIGSTGQRHDRNSSTLVNVAYNATLTWAHPELIDLERQHLIPMFGSEPVELGLGGHEERLLSQLKSDPHYQRLFAEAFGGSERAITLDNIVKALASFSRSLISFRSPFDRYAYYAEDDALSDSAKRGMTLFFSERLECHHCHGGFNFSQSSTHENTAILEKPFHNTGVGDDAGIGALTEQPRDWGKFRAPSLRNVAVSAPYMHDGSIKTLEEVIEFYERGGSDETDNPVSPFITGFQLTNEQRQDLISFLESLTDQDFLTSETHSDPFQLH